MVSDMGHGILDRAEGEHLQMDTEDGQEIPVQVVEVGEREVVVDANHPLAGKALTFEIELIDIS